MSKSNFSFFHIILFSCFWFLVSQNQVLALGIGQCHTGGISSSAPEVQWSYVSGEATWDKIEPSDNNFDWSSIDSAIEINKKAGKKIWLQIVTNSPKFQVMPQWVKEKGVDVHEYKNSDGSIYLDYPNSWSNAYYQQLQELLTAMHQRYEVDKYVEYGDTIEAILIMAGGGYGEMAIWYNDWSIEMMKKDLAAKGITVTAEQLKTPINSSDTGYLLFDQYFVDEVVKTVKMYAQTFTKYPVVLQLGNGLGYSMQTPEKVLDTVIPLYGSHVQLKYNGWGTYASVDRNYFKLFQKYANKTVAHVEQGVLYPWCGADAGYTKGGCFDCCQWDTTAEALDHNKTTIDTTITQEGYPIPYVVSACFYPDMFTNRNRYQVDYTKLAEGLNKNIQRAESLGLLAHQDLAVIAASKKGDINGDGFVDADDLIEILKNWQTGDVTKLLLVLQNWSPRN